MSKIVGIDLGTTNSLVAIVDSGIPYVIADPDGQRLTPSVVHSIDGAIGPVTHTSPPGTSSTGWSSNRAPGCTWSTRSCALSTS
jgi:hypothetical protein